jgi:hypothetical protein
MSNPIPTPPISQSSPSGTVKGTMRIFPSLKAYMDFYDAIVLEATRVGRMPDTYLGVFNTVRAGSVAIINDQSRATSWFGVDYPKSYDELMSRDEYTLMPEYKEVYETYIKPRVNEIMKESKAALETPTLKYNDIGLGIFDFARASLGLLPLYKYYSLKHKKYVEGVDTYVKSVKGEYKTFLKMDDSPVVVVPQLREGYDESVVYKAFKQVYDGENLFEILKKYDLKIGKFTSTIKKTYLYKENIPKPLNAVRIFIYVGGASGVSAEQFKWTGYTGIGITELLTAMGYNVSVHAVFGTGTEINDKRGGFETGVRASAVTLKPFQETLHSQKLLYVVSDPSFFRGKEFINIMKKSQVYQDYIDSGLGYPVGTNQVKYLAYNLFGSIDKHKKSDGSYNAQSGILYYTVANIKSLDQMNQEILNIALSVVNENVEARQSMTQQPTT